MASTTRGKLKEHVEGMHRDCDWIKQHCQQSLAMLSDDYPEHIKSFESIAEITDQLDSFVGSLYSKL